MAADRKPLRIPEGPVSLREVAELAPTLRQSLLASYDSCPRAAAISMDLDWGWSSPEAAAGTMFHSFAAEALRTMVRQGERRLPVAEGLSILYDVARQNDVPPHERVHVPTRQWPKLRTGVIKFCNDNVFSIEKIVAVEERLSATVSYDAPDGTVVTRTVTGQPDLLLWNPPDAAIVLDWKLTYGLPARPRVVEGQEPAWENPEKQAERRLSAAGYFQQRAYGWLVLKTYPSVTAVTLREFYVLKGQVREATITRADLEHVESEIALLAHNLDRDLTAGRSGMGRGLGGDPFPAQPGMHCSYCPRPAACPIEPDARGKGAIETEDQAERYAAELQVATAVRGNRIDALKAWCSEHGPVPVRNSKGRRVVGFNLKPDGRQVFEVFTPEESDRGTADPALEDSRLAEAFAAAAADLEDDGRPSRRTRLLDARPGK